MTPLERAARALYALTPQTIDVFTRDCANPKAGVSRETRPMPWDDLDEETRGPFMNSARAVLAAIRFAPDDDFFALAGEELPPEFQSRGDKGVIACTIWQAMIDAALSEKPE